MAEYGAFAVFGVTRTACRRKAEKLADDELRRLHKLGEGMTQSAWKHFVETQTEALYAQAKPEKVSRMFPAPQFAADFMRVAEQGGVGRALSIRVREIVTDATGKPVLSKNKKPKRRWKDWKEVA